MLIKFEDSNNRRLDSLSLGLKDILGPFSSLSHSCPDGSIESSNEDSNNDCEKSLGVCH